MRSKRLAAILVAAAVSTTTGLMAQSADTDSIADADSQSYILELYEKPAPADSCAECVADSAAAAESPYDRWEERTVAFNPDPSRAVWMSALFPGLGQIYNRRYWKLPLIVGGYLGLGYATSWNNGMLDDYSRAYRDIMDNDPTTKSYMDFFPPTVSEDSLDKAWLTRLLQSRKNYYRRNRDLCIIAMVGVYLLAMVDAYVDASLSHFDISPDLSMDIAPAIIKESRGSKPAIGLQWAFTF
ncbi:MAG: hypothetical protein J6J20_09325 [Muribaculaceae bacterium]|nr:hypothetical protein [Muribaculaceae bacterium]